MTAKLGKSSPVQISRGLLSTLRADQKYSPTQALLLGRRECTFEQAFTIIEKSIPYSVNGQELATLLNLYFTPSSSRTQRNVSVVGWALFVDKDVHLAKCATCYFETFIPLVVRALLAKLNESWEEPKRPKGSKIAIDASQSQAELEYVYRLAEELHQLLGSLVGMILVRNPISIYQEIFCFQPELSLSYVLELLGNELQIEIPNTAAGMLEIDPIQLSASSTSSGQISSLNLLLEYDFNNGEMAGLEWDKNRDSYHEFNLAAGIPASIGAIGVPRKLRKRRSSIISGNGGGDDDGARVALGNIGPNGRGAGSSRSSSNHSMGSNGKRKVFAIPADIKIASDEQLSFLHNTLTNNIDCSLAMKNGHIDVDFGKDGYSCSQFSITTDAANTNKLEPLLDTRPTDQPTTLLPPHPQLPVEIAKLEQNLLTSHHDFFTPKNNSLCKAFEGLLYNQEMLLLLTKFLNQSDEILLKKIASVEEYEERMKKLGAKLKHSLSPEDLLRTLASIQQQNNGASS